jgi:hypothetical protein
MRGNAVFTEGVTPHSLLHGLLVRVTSSPRVQNFRKDFYTIILIFYNFEIV